MQSLIDLAETIESLGERFKPHAVQAEIGRAILFENAKKVMAVCGRSLGKSQLAAYLNSRLAAETRNATNFIFLPFLTQGREVYWQPKLLHKMIPEEWIESVNNTEMRITLKNGSYIKICGADNVESYRGVKLNPGSMVTLEEAKDLKQDFIDAMLPNLSVNDPVLLIIGTPDSREGVFSSFMELAQKSPEWRYFHAPSSANPYVSKEFLDQEKIRLEALGEIETYYREYEAVYVKGGKRSIFPMTINTPNPTFEEVKPKDLHKWRIMVTMDPAATSVWAVVFILHNPHTKKSIIFDELYVDEPALMTARSMHKLIDEKLKPYQKLVKEIEFCYDESAAFCRNEFAEVCDWWLIPSRKAQLGIQGYIDLIRTVFLKDLVIMCAEVPKLRWELAQAEKDDNGRIPDKNNHATDALGYGLQALGLDLELRPEVVIIQEDRRGFTIEEEISMGSSYEEI